MYSNDLDETVLDNSQYQIDLVNKMNHIIRKAGQNGLI